MDNSFKNIFKASGAAAFGQVLNIANQLLLVPIYMKFWGPQLYGEWIILSAAPSVIAMAGDLGFGTVAANEMNICVARDNRTDALKVFQNSWIVISSFSLLFFLIASVIIFLSPIDAALNIKTIAESDSRIILILFLLNLIMGQQNQLLLAALRCEGNYVTGMVIGNFSKLAEILLTVFLISFYKSVPLGIVTGILSVSVCTFIVLKLILASKSPWIKYGIEHRSLKMIKEHVPLAVSFLSFPITQAFSIQGAIIIVGSVLGPTAVVLFSTCRTFMNVIKQVVSIINASIWPELTTAYAKGDFEKLKKIFVHAVQVLFLIIISFNLFVLVLGKPLYLMWTKHKIHISDPFFYTFAIITSISAVWNLFGIIQGATNKAKKYAMYNIISIAILIGMIVVCTKLMGVNGIIVSLLASELFMLIFVTRNSLFILEIRSFFSFWESLIKIRPKFLTSTNH